MHLTPLTFLFRPALPCPCCRRATARPTPPHRCLARYTWWVTVGGGRGGALKGQGGGPLGGGLGGRWGERGLGDRGGRGLGSSSCFINACPSPEPPWPGLCFICCCRLRAAVCRCVQVCVSPPHLVCAAAGCAQPCVCVSPPHLACAAAGCAQPRVCEPCCGCGQPRPGHGPVELYRQLCVLVPNRFVCGGVGGGQSGQGYTPKATCGPSHPRNYTLHT